MAQERTISSNPDAVPVEKVGAVLREYSSDQAAPVEIPEIEVAVELPLFDGLKEA